MDKFDGVWVSTREENLDAFLKAIGANMIVRGAAKAITTTLNISYKEDGKFTVKSSSGPFSREKTFTLGKAFDDKGPVGDEVTGAWRMEGDEMVGEFMTKANREIVMRRSVAEDVLCQNMTAGNVSCIRWFKRK